MEIKKTFVVSYKNYRLYNVVFYDCACGHKCIVLSHNQ